MDAWAWFWFTAGAFTMGIVNLAVVKLLIPELLRRREYLGHIPLPQHLTDDYQGADSE